MSDHLALIRELSNDRALASSMLFEHRHPNETPVFHVDLLDDWASPHPWILTEAFRGGAKSTLAEESTIMEAAFGNFHYCLIIGETYDKACDRLAAIKYELRHNAALNNIFGKLEGKIWNENEIVLKRGDCKIEAIGWEQEIRSYKYLTWRPERALLDDIESRESVRDDETVDRNITKLYSQLIPAMDPIHRIRMVGTPLAANCMVVVLKDSAGWRSKSYPICNGDIDDENTIATWPTRFSMAYIRNLRDTLEANGQLKSFMQEYMLVPHTSLVKPFEPDKVREVLDGRYDRLPKMAAFDPARTANVEKSDRSGKAVVSFSGSKIVVHESRGSFHMPDEVQKDIVDTSREHRPIFLGVEKNSLDEWLLQPLRTLMLKLGEIVPLVPLNAPQDRDKDAFIMGLQSFIRAGDLLLVGGKAKHADLMGELANFPAGKKDVLNALALAVRMRPGLAVYDEVSEENIVDFMRPQPLIPLQLAVNATPSETTFVLLQMEGQYMHVFQDWIQVGSCDDAVKHVSMAIRQLYPNNRDLQVWAPADVHDNWARTQIVAACRRQGLTAYRGEYTAKCRGGLADMLRTRIRDRRLLTISPEAFNFTNGLAGGYHSTIKQNGNVSDTPAPNEYRTLIEAVESIVNVVAQGFGGDPMKGAHQATTAEGVPYYSSMPGKMRG